MRRESVILDITGGLDTLRKKNLRSYSTNGVGRCYSYYDIDRIYKLNKIIFIEGRWLRGV